MNKQDLVGRCGLYCGSCVIYRAERDSPEKQKQLAEKWKCAPEKVRCNGCGALTSNCWGFDCKFVVCQNKKGYKFCYECPDYDSKICKMYEDLSKSYLEEDGVDMRKSLAMIKQGKIDDWLELMNGKYTCKFCGKPTMTGAEKCHHCEKKT